MMKQISLAVVLMAACTLTSFAQKFGHVDTQDVLLNLPERSEAQATIEARAAEYETELARMQQEFQTKYAEYQSKGSTWPAAILEQKQRELQGLEQGMQDFNITAQNELGQLQDELLIPIVERVQNAINEVGAENGFTYIFDTSVGAVVYIDGEDVGTLVRAKLGI
jgi:outer membrane protein